MAVSIPHRYQQAKATGVSDNRATWSTGPGCDARERRRCHLQPNFARNLTRSFFETPQKRCNSNDANSMFELVEGELRAKLLRDSHSWASGRRAEPPARTPSAAGVEGTGGPGCGTRGRRDPATLVWRAPEGPEGTGGLRDRPLRAFRLACGDLAGGRALRRPKHPWSHKQHHARTHASQRRR